MSEFTLPDSPIIDCRDNAKFKQQHLKGSVNIPSADLFLRMHELPEKQQSLAVVVDQSSRTTAEQFFTERNFIIKCWLNEDCLADASASLLADGHSHCYHWQPAPFIKHCEANFFKPRLNKQDGVIVDLACGAGRDSVYLAMQGWQVVGVDHSATALQRCQTTASQYQQTVVVKQADLEKAFQFESLKIEQPILGIVVCRYLHRPLFEAIKQALAPGGIIAYHTFMQGCEKIGSPRNPNYLLKPNELARVFNDYDLLQNKETQLSDGRPVAEFIAQKPTRAF